MPSDSLFQKLFGPESENNNNKAELGTRSGIAQALQQEAQRRAQSKLEPAYNDSVDAVELYHVFADGSTPASRKSKHFTNPLFDEDDEEEERAGSGSKTSRYFMGGLSPGSNGDKLRRGLSMKGLTKGRSFRSAKSLVESKEDSQDEDEVSDKLGNGLAKATSDFKKRVANRISVGKRSIALS